ncbi:MAG: hypothetical protein M1167_00010, partial [Chloroflexi bacterium]|nr:hypothetical protein [Chloroflexota bacterium]
MNCTPRTVNKLMQELTRNKRGLQSDKLLLETINNYPGLSQYELTKRLDWPSGKVDGAIRRLVNNNQILIKSTQRNGRLVNLIYAKDHKPPNVIEVPISLLQIGNQTWADSAYVYALDSTTIGIAGTEMPEWKEIACFTETTPIKKDKENIVLQIPEKFNRFYNLERKHKVVTVNGNAILITITG